MPPMDGDVALFHHDREELQRMLDIPDDIATGYHIKFGKEKREVLKNRENANRTAIQTWPKSPGQH